MKQSQKSKSSNSQSRKNTSISSIRSKGSFAAKEFKDLKSEIKMAGEDKFLGFKHNLDNLQESIRPHDISRYKTLDKIVENMKEH